MSVPQDSNVTPAMRRYAAEIYRLQEDRPQVGLSEIAEHVDASPQAVSRMLQRMKEAGLIDHEPYRGVRLTVEGERVSLPALRRHRLAEVFLVQVMGFGWDEVHELCDHFERGVNDPIEDRMDELAGHPTRCPHGEPIPSRDGVMPVVEDRSLVECPAGETYVLSRVRTHDPERLRYLATHGLTPRTRFEYLSAAPFSGPLRVRVGAAEHVLGHDLAAALFVETSG